jgi:DNA-binding transcriptional ArsR family regulator
MQVMDDSIEQERIQADGDQVWDLVTQPGGWVPDDGEASGHAAVTTAGAVQIFAALADPTRAQLLELLGGSPERSASALACLVPVSRQAVTQHLATLEECGLVQRRRAGREVLFSVRPDRLAATACWLADRADAWRSRLELLGREARNADRR